MKNFFKSITLSILFIPFIANALEMEEIVFPGQNGYKEVRIFKDVFSPIHTSNAIINSQLGLPYIDFGEMNGPNSYTPGKEPRLVLGGTVVQNWINTHPEVIIGMQSLCVISPGAPNCSSYTFPNYNLSIIPAYYYLT